jgi:hypothetical protein
VESFFCFREAVANKPALVARPTVKIWITQDRKFLLNYSSENNGKGIGLKVLLLLVAFGSA